jgi:hypothetical protein
MLVGCTVVPSPSREYLQRLRPCSASVHLSGQCGMRRGSWLNKYLSIEPYILGQSVFLVFRRLCARLREHGIYAVVVFMRSSSSYLNR